MVEEDIGFGDITTYALIDKSKIAKGKLISKENGVIAGVSIVKEVLEDYHINIKTSKEDGELVKQGDTIFEIKGSALEILKLERTILNLLMRMSGIATITNNLSKEVSTENPNIKIAGTRKTAPGLSKFDNLAITIGGGDSHRFRLDDMVLIKDNHISVVGSVEEAVKIAKEKVSFTKKIEVEVENKEDALKVAKLGVDIVMLDNMSVNEIKDTISIVKKKGLRDNVIIEASGGIKPENILEYSKTGVDIISLGFITHSVKSLDLSLNLEIE
jgi:nicotinate-nucleotide pyrophosphorylase (carboxylating)